MRKVAKSKEKRIKVVKSWKKLEKVEKTGEKWRKVGEKWKSGQKVAKCS